MWQASRKKKLENNPNHAPAGDSKGGQFTKGDGGSGSDDKDISKTNISLNKDRIKNLTQSFADSPHMADDGKTFRDFGISVNDSRRQMSNSESDAMDKALEDSNHEISDNLFMKAVKKDSKLLTKYKETSEEVEGYNKALKIKLSKAEYVHRFMGVAELDNYVNTGEFQSRATDFVSFTVEKQSEFFSHAGMVISVPADTIRDQFKTVEYTPLPTNEEPDKEKISSRKHASYASETEVRLPSNTRVPSNLQIEVNEYVSQEEAEAMKIKYNKLGTIVFNNIMREILL